MGAPKQRWFGRVVVFAVFLFFVVFLSSLVSGSRSTLDVLLRRNLAEKVGRPLSPMQMSYAVLDRNGSAVRLQDIQAPLIFLNFWATYCKPCVEELPSLLAMARSREKQGLVVLAVSYDESFDAIDKFFQDFTSAVIPKNFLVLRDPEPVQTRDMKALFGTEKIPESYIIVKNTVIARFINARDWVHPDMVSLFNLLLQ